MSRAVSFLYPDPNTEVTVKLSETAKITGIQCFDLLDSWDFPGAVHRLADNEIKLDFTFDHFTDLGDQAKSVEIHRIRRERSPFAGRIVIFYDFGLPPTEEGGAEEQIALLPIAVADLFRPTGAIGTPDDPWPNPLTEQQGIALENSFRQAPAAVHRRYLAFRDRAGQQLRLGDRVTFEGVQFFMGLKGRAYFLLNTASAFPVQHMNFDGQVLPVQLVPRESEDEEAFRQITDCNIFIQ
ncbi:hypothetical protein UFOVP1492_25 [uncultured Caudovirales phage]|uniref:Uncharacterized protein n=1 Tax=uncultured Caudovirales phage TaxID=2100421 RepID=A0A6J5R983_9CAUD|nr:hypothetical protein UFOVP1127_109 [uncultured Caudovirales phage]CAB4193549.1 hypothetical protein UFOVP1242_101 [uncultured Caudovirales phage]CAB4217378.1 hypothetical protein UFOVP1492_25 [uncultured Caudovirales phage]CAB5231300.1 hypothetical protein UFOVP1580_54 [uncultured Caudovirales phage]